MFELFTYEAIYALREAQKIAQQSRSLYIEPEHILLGLRKEGIGSAARFLQAKNISFDQLEKYFKQTSNPDGSSNLRQTDLPFSAVSYEVLNSIYDAANKSSKSLIGQKELFIKLFENSSLVRASLEELNAKPAKKDLDNLDDSTYQEDLKLPATNRLVMQNLQALNLFEISCFHSAFVYTGAFREIVIENLDAIPMAKLLKYVQQKYVVHGELVVCEGNRSPEPIHIMFEHADMNGWSWDKDQIEFSFVPEEFRDTRLKIAVLDFMAGIASLIDIPVGLSDEGLEKDPWIVLHPDGNMGLLDYEVEEFT